MFKQLHIFLPQILPRSVHPSKPWTVCLVLFPAGLLDIRTERVVGGVHSIPAYRGCLGETRGHGSHGAIPSHGKAIEYISCSYYLTHTGSRSHTPSHSLARTLSLLHTHTLSLSLILTLNFIFEYTQTSSLLFIYAFSIHSIIRSLTPIFIFHCFHSCSLSL